jgi:hypothetical protein
MRTFQFTLFLLGLLAFFAVSVPVTWDGNVLVRGLDQLTYREHVGDDELAKRTTSLSNSLGAFKNGDVQVRGLDELTHKKNLSEDGLTTRAIKKKAPKKKTTSKKKKTSTKKKTPTKTKTPTTKTPAPKVCTRTEAGGCIKTANYEVAAAAAKKKGQTLELGESYLLKVRSGVHKQIVLGKVVKNAKGELDFEAAMSELFKDPGDGNKLVRACKMLHGAKCEEHSVESYSCSRSLENGAKFKFVGAAKPEFADAKKFISDGGNLGSSCIRKR